MTLIKHNNSNKQRRSQRVHYRVKATTERPKLLITRTNKSIYLQVLDENGKVLLSESSLSASKQKKLKSGLTKTAQAAEVGKILAEKMKKAKIKSVAVDRGANKFHGRIKAAVEAIRESGIEA